MNFLMDWRLLLLRGGLYKLITVNLSAIDLPEISNVNASLFSVEYVSFSRFVAEKSLCTYIARPPVEKHTDGFSCRVYPGRSNVFTSVLSEILASWMHITEKYKFFC